MDARLMLLATEVSLTLSMKLVCVNLHTECFGCIHTKDRVGARSHLWGHIKLFFSLCEHTSAYETFATPSPTINLAQVRAQH